METEAMGANKPKVTAGGGEAAAGGKGGSVASAAAGGKSIPSQAVKAGGAGAPPKKKKKATKPTKLGAKKAREQEIAALAAFADSDVVAADDVLPSPVELEAAAAAAKVAMLVNWTCR